MASNPPPSNPGAKYMDPPPAYSEADPQKFPPGAPPPPQSNPGTFMGYNGPQQPPYPTGFTTTYPHPPADFSNVIHHQNYGATITDQPVTVPVTQVILIGGCPSCRVGILEDSFSILGILCAIIFFPIGLLCCLALRDKRCSNCGATF